MWNVKQFLAVLVLIMVTFQGFSEPRTYKIATVNWAGWSFLDVAEVKGYWKELGVNVEIHRFSDGAIMHDKMITGDVDFCMNMMPYTVWMHQKVKPVSVLMETNWSHGGDKIILRSPEQFLSGGGKKIIGVYLSGYPLEYFLNSYLKSKGLNFRDYSLVKMQPSELVKQFNIGRIDAAVIFEPLASKITQTGIGTVVATTADYPGVIREGIYTFHDRLVTYPKEDIIKILQGIIRATQWIDNRDNRSEFYTILNEKTFFTETTDFTPEQLELMLSEVKIHSSTAIVERNFEELAEYFKNLNIFLNEQGWIKSSEGEVQLLYLSYLQEALQLEQNR